MDKRLNKYIFILLLIFLLSNVVFAAEPIKDIPSLNNAKEKDICNAVKKTIQEGINTKDVVKTGIKLGHSACLIVKCAISGGGNVKEIVVVDISARHPRHHFDNSIKLTKAVLYEKFIIYLSIRKLSILNPSKKS